MSAEVLLLFEEPVAAADGALYHASACGRETNDGRWEGWIEFAPVIVGDDVLRSARETTQPNRADLTYWATGLSAVYLQGSLERTLAPRARPMLGTPVRPAYDGPVEVRPSPSALADAPPPRAVLDPFAVYAQGEDVLRRELGALDRDHLANIVSAFGLAVGTQKSREEMAAGIVEQVKGVGGWGLGR
ncbi:MAG: hypothetical protein M3081_21815 [Gemmatimonadota bacterium]|nr:hypothetical protein [Gemmatimonadota bacterium]